MPKFSVIIPAFIKSPQDVTYLKQALFSIERQTLKDYEIILVDDNSPHQFIQEIKNHYYSLRYVKNDTNRGVGYTRQRGVELSNGEYITFLSHDDLWEANYLEEMAKHLGEWVLYSDFYILNMSNRVRSLTPTYQYQNKEDFKNYTWKMARKYWTPIHWSGIVIPKAFLQKLPINKRKRIAEDYEWVLKACYLFEFKRVPKALETARYHSTMGSRGANYVKVDTQIMTEVQAWLSKRGIK